LTRCVDVSDGDPRMHAVTFIQYQSADRKATASGSPSPYVEPDALPGRAVVVEVSRDLQQPAPIVARPRLGRPLRVRRVAVVLARPVDLIDVAELCTNRISTHGLQSFHFRVPNSALKSEKLTYGLVDGVTLAKKAAIWRLESIVLGAGRCARTPCSTRRRRGKRRRCRSP
jgi:hypothetical protein